MEQEHMIIIALLVVALYFLMMRKACACPRVGQGFGIERFDDIGTSSQPIIGAGWIRNRAVSGLVTDTTPSPTNPNWIRKRVGDYDAISNRVQNRNHNMYQSQHVKHHLKADHRGKMMRNMMGRQLDDKGAGPDGAGSF